MWKLTFRKGSVELTEFSENSFREFLVQEKMLNNILILSPNLGREVFPMLKAFTKFTKYFAKHIILNPMDHKVSYHHH